MKSSGAGGATTVDGADADAGGTAGPAIAAAAEAIPMTAARSAGGITRQDNRLSSLQGKQLIAALS